MERRQHRAGEGARAAKLDPAQERDLRANERAWSFFNAQPPSYRKAAIWWIVSGKRDETKAKRLAQLIEDSAHGRDDPAAHTLEQPAHRGRGVRIRRIGRLDRQLGDRDVGGAAAEPAGTDSAAQLTPREPGCDAGDHCASWTEASGDRVPTA